jgi:hypothetical protein
MISGVQAQGLSLDSGFWRFNHNGQQQLNVWLGVPDLPAMI